MASNKDNQLVEENDNLEVGNISNDNSSESEQKSEVSKDESSHKKEDIDTVSYTHLTLPTKA